MSGLPRSIVRLVAVVALAASLQVATPRVAIALPISPGCAAINAGLLNLTGPGTGTTSQDFSVGDVITLQYISLLVLLVTVEALTVVNFSGGGPQTGSASTTITKQGANNIDHVITPDAGGSLSATCTPAGGGSPAPLTNAELAAVTRDALTQGIAPARPSPNPQGLPESQQPDLCEFLRQRVRALVTRAEELEFEGQALTIAYAESRKKLLSAFPGESIAEQNVNAGNALTDLAVRLARNTAQIADNAAQLDSARASLAACEVENPSSGSADDDESGEFGDGEEVFFFPQPDSHVPWPVVHAYAGGSLDTGSDRFFEIGGMPANFWTRIKGSILDGAFGRSGVAGSLQAGLTVGVTDEVDLGVYGYLLTGRVTSTPLSGELTTLAAALGAYVKARLDNGMTLGLSASQEIGTNAITLSGATGSFFSSLTTLDASVGFEPIRLDGFILTPSAALGWKHTVNGGYTDSNALVVPQTASSTLAASAALGIAYPMAGDGVHVATMTPNASIAGSFFILPGSSLALTPGTLSPARFTLDASAGVSLELIEGGTIDFAVSASGLLGPSQAYGVRAGLRVPIN